MTKILVKLSDKQVGRPMASEIILDLKVPLNILSANVTPKGGEILVDVPSHEINRVVEAFRKRDVTVAIQKGIDVDKDRCINCGACYSLCPVDAISFTEDYSVIFDGERCISCGLCVNSCPRRAIKI